MLTTTERQPPIALRPILDFTQWRLCANRTLSLKPSMLLIISNWITILTDPQPVELGDDIEMINTNRRLV